MASSIKLCRIFSVIIFLPVFFWAFDASGRESLDENIKKYCLRLCYPEIGRIDSVEENLYLSNGSIINYRSGGECGNKLAGSLFSSMDETYFLEPDRRISQSDNSPGRKRPYGFYEKFYGNNPDEVKRGLKSIIFFNKKISLARQAAEQFAKIVPQLLELGRKNPEIKKFLVPEGGYYWRNISGEDKLSAHSFGIALDLGVKSSPYWRWSKLMPHPLQFSYPGEIVNLFEKHGFIWGGKWKEYDLMHFEYRPELICVSKMRKFLKKPFSGFFHDSISGIKNYP